MKKLLLLINLTLLLQLLPSCQNHQPLKKENGAENKPVVKQDPIATDTTKSSGQAPVSGTTNSDHSLRKDSSLKSATPTPVVHQAPDQEKIDSIKNAKTKSKK